MLIVLCLLTHFQILNIIDLIKTEKETKERKELLFIFIITAICISITAQLILNI